MASVTKAGSWKFRIDPNNHKNLQRATINSNSWDFCGSCNGHEILDLMPQGEDLIIFTDYGKYIRKKTGGIFPA